MDVVVTLPLSIGLDEWIAEGDAAGEPGEWDEWTGRHYYWKVPSVPNIEIEERVYVVHNGRLIGYAPLRGITVDETFDGNCSHYLWRGGGAVAVTIDEHIKGFRGYRYRWWDRSDEYPFPEWKECGVR